jgi:hypothetical protein
VEKTKVSRKQRCQEPFFRFLTPLFFPAGLKATAQAQFSAQLALEKGNPTYDNIKRDFNRFGFLLDLQAAHPAGPQQVTDLGHLNDWRNKAAHQGTQPLGGGVPAALTLPIVQGWRTSCEGLATSLDGIMRAELLRIMGVFPLEPRDKREPVSSVRTEPLDMSAARALGPGRTPNGLDAQSFFAWSNFEVQDVA